MHLTVGQWAFCAIIAFVIFKVIRNAKHRHRTHDPYFEDETEDEVLARFLVWQAKESGLNEHTIRRLKNMDYATLNRYLIRERIMTHEDIQNCRATVQRHMSAVHRVIRQ